MSLFNPFKSRPRMPHGSVKSSRSEPRSKEKDNFFGGKDYLSRRELRWKLKQDSGKIPGSNKWYTRQERGNMEKELFDRKIYGDYLTPQEVKRRLKKMRQSKFREKTGKGKIEIDRKIRYLKEKFFGPGH